MTPVEMKACFIKISAGGCCYLKVLWGEVVFKLQTLRVFYLTPFNLAEFVTEMRKGGKIT